MADWQEDFQEMVDTLTEAVEECFGEVGEAIAAIAEEIEMEIAREIEYFLQDLWETSANAHGEDEGDFFAEFSDDSEFFLNPKVEPTPETYPACVGCRHYHGRVYSGNLLVCAMHPYGWQDANCPDWEVSNS